MELAHILKFPRQHATGSPPSPSPQEACALRARLGTRSVSTSYIRAWRSYLDLHTYAFLVTGKTILQ